MALKIKGFRKGLRYISQIFEPKEHEIQIGYPTDVKHVAHIGWDSPTANTPSWMNEFHSAPLSATVTPDDQSVASNQWGSQDFSVHSAQESPTSSVAPRPRRRAASSTQAMDSPRRDSSHSGSHHSEGGDSVHSPNRESRRHRRQPRSTDGGGGVCDSPSSDLPAIPRQSRRRKSKASSGGSGSSRLSRSKAPEPDSDASSSATKPVPQLQPTPEENEEKEEEEEGRGG